jgi:hypothetical protein
VLLLNSISFALDLQADLYELKTDSITAKFHFVLRDNVQNQKLNREIEFKDVKGQVVTQETVHFAGDSGLSDILDYNLDQKQMHLKVKIIRRAEKDKTAKYEIKVIKGEAGDEKTQSEDFEIKPNLILPTVLLDVMTSHSEIWEQDKEWEFRLLIPDLLQTVGMRVTLVKDAKPDSILRLKMRPSTWAIAAFVDPLYFELDKVTHKIKRAEGRTLLLGDSGEPFVARTEFKP